LKAGAKALVKAGKGTHDVPDGPKTIEETAEENVEEAGLTSEDLEEIIGELESEVSAEEGTFEGDDELPSAAPAPAAPVDPAAVAPAPVPAPCPGAAPVPGAPAPVAPPLDPMAAPVAPVAPVVPPAPGDEEDVNLEELIRSLSEEVEDEEEEEKCDEAVENGLPKNVGGQDAIKSPQTYPKTTSNQDIEAGGKNHNISGKGNIGDGDPSGLKMENANLKKEISEFRKVVEYLRGQLNETNLLNSKLLYVNKLVKEHRLSGEQVKKIVDTFDLSKNVREVKLTYAALKESMNFGVTAKFGKTSKTVQSITEGLASKAVASTKPSKEIISEGVDETVARFKKLANIRDGK
jgi:hypothetical protein